MKTEHSTPVVGGYKNNDRLTTNTRQSSSKCTTKSRVKTSEETRSQGGVWEKPSKFRAMQY